MLHDTMSDNHLTLFCLVNGEATPFSVEVDPSKTVDHLKKAIKAEKTNVLGDVDADEFTLWHVSIPIPPPKERKPVFLLEAESPTELDPSDNIEDAFRGRAHK
ncbi:hypothetical protein BKA57DRAFT_511482 [Linnemannia elongata]|nr:hypothetical protein BKA57DRAFT_511482 [Linnemannia elongata]